MPSKIITYPSPFMAKCATIPGVVFFSRDVTNDRDSVEGNNENRLHQIGS